MQAGQLADFAAGLLGVGSSFALPTAVGIWAEGGAAATQAGLDVVPNLVHLLEAGMVELYSTLGSHLWKGVLHDAIANEINGVAPHLRPTAARMAGTAFRRTVEKLVAPSPAPAPAPTSQQVPLGMPAPAGQAPLGMPIGASAPAPTIPGLSPDSQREHAALSQRMAVLQQRALGVQPSLTGDLSLAAVGGGERRRHHRRSPTQPGMARPRVTPGLRHGLHSSGRQHQRRQRDRGWARRRRHPRRTGGHARSRT